MTDDAARHAPRADDTDGDWPDWARPQLRHAVELAARIRARGERIALAPELYRTWFNPAVGDQAESSGLRRPLAGVYRSAHAGSALRTIRDGMSTVCRQDALGRDGWWRTWGEQWRPRQSRETSVRVVLTPRPDALADLIRELTSALLATPVPWMVACSTDVWRLRRTGGCVLHLPDRNALPGVFLSNFVSRIAPLVLPVTPPLCLPLGAGIGLADTPDNGMSFGELRCHLLALGLCAPAARRQPLQALADAFAAHGLNSGTPWLSRCARRPADQPSGHRLADQPDGLRR
jgi:hypothetical protein